MSVHYLVQATHARRGAQTPTCLSNACRAAIKMKESRLLFLLLTRSHKPNKASSRLRSERSENKRTKGLKAKTTAKTKTKKTRNPRPRKARPRGQQPRRSQESTRRWCFEKLLRQLITKVHDPAP